jgi:hypothetical protein
VTTVEACYYSPDEYAKFTPAKKQKHFQLMHAAKAAKSPAKTSSTSATMAELTTAVSAVSAAASAISELTVASTKRAAADCEVTNDSDANDKPGWGRNRDNPAVAGHQEHVDLSTKINSIGETTLELDSHADTCVLDCNALILLDYNRPVIVEGYDPSLGTKTYATVSGVLAYDDPVTGEVYHVVINQAIHIPHLNHHLLCPMQC